MSFVPSGCLIFSLVFVAEVCKHNHENYIYIYSTCYVFTVYVAEANQDVYINITKGDPEGYFASPGFPLAYPPNV